MKAKVLKPNVIRGGQAVPLGNNTYYMRGRKHKDGGIDIGNKTEVEDGEVIKIDNKEAKIFSSVPFLNGSSPAEKVMGGSNPTKVFNDQEEYKDKNNLNDDGTMKSTNSKRKALGGRPRIPFVQTEVQEEAPLGYYGSTGLPIGGGLVTNRQPIVSNNNPTFTNRGTSFNPITFSNSDSAGLTSSTGGAQTASTEGVGSGGLKSVTNAIGRGASKAFNFIKSNPVESSDVAGLASNVIGSLISNRSNNRMLDRMRYRNAPTPRQASKLKTNVNINPQLDNARESLAEFERDVDANTASSRVGLARKQRGRLATSSGLNELYANKENVETQLINQDKMNQQTVSNANITDYNAWNEGKANFDNTVNEKRSENTVDLIQNLNSGVQDVLGRADNRRASKQNALIMMAGNPNVNPRILRDRGVTGITDKMIRDYENSLPKNKKK